jgi:uncharacterized coiled-coil protein SlyX
MNDDVIQDLKQFITGTVRLIVREEVDGLSKRMDKLENRMDGLETRIDRIGDSVSRLEVRVKNVEVKVDDLTHFVTDAIDTSNSENGKQRRDHERRITKLETAT